MRLIDADELKNSLNFVYGCAYIESKSKEGIASDIIEEIDNAPTVPLPDFKEGYKQAIIDGKTNFSRPQGEWVEVIDYSDEHEKRWHYECSKCRNIPYYGGDIDTLHFCPNCGADMRGKE